MVLLVRDVVLYEHGKLFKSLAQALPRQGTTLLHRPLTFQTVHFERDLDLFWRHGARLVLLVGEDDQGDVPHVVLGHYGVQFFRRFLEPVLVGAVDHEYDACK